MRCLALLAVLALTACGPFVDNADKPNTLRLAGAAGSVGDSGVQTSGTAPASGGVPVSGVSCKNLMWDADPTEASAVAELKQEAHAAGMNNVFITSIGPDSGALLKNCWSAIVAKGIAFNR